MRNERQAYQAICKSIETQCAKEREVVDMTTGFIDEWTYCILHRTHTGPCLDVDGHRFNFGV